MTSPIVVFDGECALCNGFVAWLIRHDTRATFKIAGSAGQVGKAAVAAMGLEDYVTRSTIVISSGPHALVRSDALLAIASGLGWPWRALGVLRVVPRGWRDAAYNAVAKRRARVTAEDPACGVPPAELVTAWRSRLATMEDLPVSAQ